MTSTVDNYLVVGCGRCPLGNTPQCKVLKWTAELEALRSIACSNGLTETIKWGVPCYTFNDKNVLIISAFKDNCFISFFKGALLKDEQGILSKGGENSEVGRLIRFTNVAKIISLETALNAFIQEAIEIEKQGLKVPRKSISDYEIPQALLTKFAEDAAFEAAFFALTPGRQKGYLFYFASAKQSATQNNRIEKCKPLIFAGKGWNER